MKIINIVLVVLGIFIFLLGFFTLEETRFGYSSHYFLLGIILSLGGFVFILSDQIKELEHESNK